MDMTVDRHEMYKSLCIFETGRRKLLDFIVVRALSTVVDDDEAAHIDEQLDDGSIHVDVEETDLGEYDVYVSGVTNSGVEIELHVLCDPRDESIVVLNDDPITYPPEQTSTNNDPQQPNTSETRHEFEANVRSD